MQAEGFKNTFDMSLDSLPDKGVHSFRKAKTNNKYNFYRWHPLNLTNRAFMRETDYAFESQMEAELPKRIY